MNKYPVTQRGYDQIKTRCEHLKKVEMPKISHDIGVARELGDLSENFEYHSAKDKQGLIAAEIRVLEDKISRAQVIDISKLSGDRVKFGAKVTIMLLETEEERTYTILGEPSADVPNFRINVASPLAKSLIGKEIGDEVKIPSKNGPVEVEIVDVTYDYEL